LRQCAAVTRKDKAVYAAKQQKAERQSFTLIDDRILARLIRDPEAMAAYMALKSHTRPGQGRYYCWPSQVTLADEMACTVITVRRRLVRLAATGLIRIEKTPKGNRYHLTVEGSSTIPDTDHQRALDTDQKRSPKQQKSKQTKKKHNKVNEATPKDRPESDSQPSPVIPAVVVSRPIEETTRKRLEAAGASLNSTLASFIVRYDSDALEQALQCLDAARNISNPAGYLRAALKDGWIPPASFVAAKEKREQEHRALVEQARATITRILEQQAGRPDLDQEVDAQLAAEEEMRVNLLHKAPRTGQELQRRREEIRARVNRNWADTIDQEERELSWCQAMLGNAPTNQSQEPNSNPYACMLS
jgi:hypothetical protein